MGILTDFFVADPAEAEDVLGAAIPTPRWRSLEAKRVDKIKLSTLGLILEGRVIDTTAAAGRARNFEHIASGGDEGPWLFLVPSSLTSSLSAVPDAALPEIADRWLCTDELQKDQWERAQALEFLCELKTLAAESEKACTPMLLRMSM